MNDLPVIFSKTATVIYYQPTTFKIGAVILAALVPITVFIQFLVILLALDALTSIYYQYKEKMRKTPGSEKASFTIRFVIFAKTIESSKLHTSLEKLVAYIIVLFVGALADYLILSPNSALAKLTSGNIAINFLTNTVGFSLTGVAVVFTSSVEIISIFANLSKITKNPVYLRIAKILNKRNEKLIDDLLKTDSNEKVQAPSEG